MSVASLIKAQWLSCGFFQQPPLMKKKIIVFVDGGKQRIFREMSGLVFRNRRGQSQLKTKQRDNEPVTEFIARWRALTFACPQKFTQQELLKMCMNNLRHDLSSILLPKTFKGFDDLCTKAHDVEAHLSKRRRPTKYLKFVPLPY